MKVKEKDNVLVVGGLVDAYVRNDSDTSMGVFAPSLTRQEFAEECDINVIMDRYENTGVINHVQEREPIYLDCTEVPDLRGAMEVMMNADKAFMTLPAKVRREFDNDAMRFVEFAGKAENLDRMREWGLAPPAEPATPKVEPVKAPAEPAPVAPKAPAQ